MSPEIRPRGSDGGGRVLVLSASNRQKSNSASIGRYLAGRLEVTGTRVSFLETGLKETTGGSHPALMGAVSESRKIVLVSSLYHDSLNFAGTSLLEKISQRIPPATGDIGASFYAIIHSGYPEPIHCRVALEICREFTREIGWNWMGGITSGGTSTIGGQPLEKLGFMTRNLRKALDLVSLAISEGVPIPREAIRIGRKPFVPPRILLFFANLMMRWEAWKSGTKDLDAQPYGK